MGFDSTYRRSGTDWDLETRASVRKVLVTNGASHVKNGESASSQFLHMKLELL